MILTPIMDPYLYSETREVERASIHRRNRKDESGSPSLKPLEGRILESRDSWF